MDIEKQVKPILKLLLVPIFAAGILEKQLRIIIVGSALYSVFYSGLLEAATIGLCEAGSPYCKMFTIMIQPLTKFGSGVILFYLLSR